MRSPILNPSLTSTTFKDQISGRERFRSGEGFRRDPELAWRIFVDQGLFYKKKEHIIIVGPSPVKYNDLLNKINNITGGCCIKQLNYSPGEGSLRLIIDNDETIEFILQEEKLRAAKNPNRHIHEIKINVEAKGFQLVLDRFIGLVIAVALCLFPNSSDRFINLLQFIRSLLL